MKKFVFCLLSYFLLAYPCLQAQDRKVLDSLQKLLASPIHDTTRTLVYHQISRAYRHSKFDSSSWYAKKGLTLANKIQFKKGIAANINGLGTLELNQGNYLVALKYALEALKINEGLGDLGEIANTKNNIGEVYRLLRNYEKALQQYEEALVINKKIKYKLGVAINLNNIGEIYTAQGKYQEALAHLQQSLELCKELKDTRRVALRLNNIGEIYEKQNQNVQARKYFEEALALHNKIGNNLYQSVALCNIAKISLKEGKPDLPTAEKAYSIALKMKAKREISNALAVIVGIYEQRQQFELAFQNYKLLNQYKDSINLEEVDKQTKQIQHEYELSKKEKEIIVLENEKKVRIQAQQVQFAYTIAFAVGILLLIILVFVQYLRNRNEKKNQQILQEKNAEIISRQEQLIAQKDVIDEQKEDLEKAYQRMLRNERKLEKTIDQLRNSEASIEKQRKELQIQNDKINSSIKSAHVIQQAILPYKQKMEELLGNYFVIYMPKDIVSGDFWWLNKVNDTLFLAAVDCTGHGVAGAFMTMIGNTLLDKIIRLRDIHNPAEILEILHEEVQIVLRQEDNNNHNGMDMSIICIEKPHEAVSRVTFAGAKQTLYYTLPEKAGEIFELKGTRKAIGGLQRASIRFENHEVELPKGSWIYTGSDGFADQNDEKRKKFSEKRIKDIIAQHQHETAETQKAVLEQELHEHMQNTEQRDDILWIGFQL